MRKIKVLAQRSGHDCHASLALQMGESFADTLHREASGTQPCSVSEVAFAPQSQDPVGAPSFRLQQLKCTASAGQRELEVLFAGQLEARLREHLAGGREEHLFGI